MLSVLPRTLTRFAATAALCVALALPPVSPAAAQRSISVVRDAEIEALVADYARPILEAAGLGKSGIVTGPIS